MPALHHIEVSSCKDDPPGESSLLFLHNLTMPNIETIVWDSSYTEVFNFYDESSIRRKFCVPPTEHFARVTTLVAQARREECHSMLTGTTLSVDSLGVCSDENDLWLDLLPNLSLLALPDYEIDSCWDGAFVKCSAIQALHVGGTNAVELISNLEQKRMDGSHSTFLPQLQSLTVHTGDIDMSSRPARAKIKRMLRKKRLEPLQLSANYSMTRNRIALQATYTLSFKRGGLEEL